MCHRPDSLFGFHIFAAMKIKYAVCTFWIALALLSSCNTDEESCDFVPNTSQVEVALKLEQHEGVLPAIQTKRELVDFFSSQPAIRDLFFNRPAYPNDSVFIDELYNRFSNPHLDTLLQLTREVFGNGDELKNELTNAFRNLKYYYPDFEIPVVKTIITGLESDIYVSDSLVIIGLDYFIGPQSKYKLNMYEYMARRYQKNFVVPSIMLLYGIDPQFNRVDPNDRTVLAEMISYGKAYHFAKHMLPCVADSVLIGYTAEEMRGSQSNEDLIWKRLVEDQVFYSTSHQIKQRYLAERPKTLEVGEKCPGRIGTWVGWRIVEKFAEKNPGMALPAIMHATDVQKIFRESGYRPAPV